MCKIQTTKREIQFIENELEQIEHQNIQISICCGEKNYTINYIIDTKLNQKEHSSKAKWIDEGEKSSYSQVLENVVYSCQ